jgi:hypothetical protein
VEIVLTLAQSKQSLGRILVADSGAGSIQCGFELLLDEDDCLQCGGNPLQPVNLGGAYAGPFPIYLIPVQIPALGFSGNLRAVGVPTVPDGFDGIAAFRLLNRFHFGNFADPNLFGLES